MSNEITYFSPKVPWLLFAPENIYFFLDGIEKYFLPVNKVHDYVAM